MFLIKLSRFLGFGAQSCAEILGGRVTSTANEMLITQLLRSDYLQPFKMHTEQRREILELLIYFYNEHGGILADLKSVQVLKDIMK